MENIQIKRNLKFGGTLDEAVEKIKNLSKKLKPGELFLCSYIDNGTKKYMLSAGVNGQDVKFSPIFSSPTEWSEMSGGFNVKNISPSSEISAQKIGNRILFNIREDGKTIQSIKTDLGELNTNMLNINSEMESISTTLESLSNLGDTYTIWFPEQNEDPTLSNLPATDWIGLNSEHVSDLCVCNGKLWRFIKDETEYKWQEINDMEISALSPELKTIWTVSEDNLQFNKPVVKKEIIISEETISKHLSLDEKQENTYEFNNIFSSGYYVLNVSGITLKLPEYVNSSDGRALVGASIIFYNDSNGNITFACYGKEPIIISSGKFLKAICEITELGDSYKIYWTY